MIHFFFFRSRRSIVRSPGASQRKAQGWATTPARNRKHMAQHPHRRQTRKKGAQHRGVPQARRGSRRNHASNGHEPDNHNGGSPRKAGQWPEQLYTGPVQKRARAVHMRARRPKRGGHAPYTKALYRNGHANMHCTHEGQKAEKVSGGGGSPQRTQERKSVRIATQSTRPRRKP